MALKLANNAISFLSSSIGTGATSLTIRSGEGSKFPSLLSGDYFPATISKTNGTFEIVKVTARSGDTFTITRAQEGTSALDFDANAMIELRLTAATAEQEFVNAYSSKTISEDTLLSDGVEYQTGSNLVVNSNANLTIPAATNLVINNYSSSAHL